MREKINHPLASYLETLIEGLNLASIAEDLEKYNVPKLVSKKRILYKAAIITICASWEAYLETVVDNSLNCLIDKATSHQQIPYSVLVRISNRLNKSPDERNIWKISDDGWKLEFRSNFDILKNNFNTPRPKNVDDFILKTLGINKISSHWHWKGQTFEKSIKKLDDFMDLRGDLTHRFLSNQVVTLKTLKSYSNFFYRIATITANVLRKHIHSLVNEYPWIYYSPRNIYN